MTGTGHRPRLAVIGAGDRGTAYASLAADAGAVIAAVAEPDDNRRTGFGERFDVPADCRSVSWDHLELTSDEVDGVVIATMDDLHVDPALRFAELRRAHTAREADRLLLVRVRSGSETGCRRTLPPIFVAHVLRYAPYTRVLRSLIWRRVRVGEIVSIHHLEPVGFWHFAHSFARGNWRSIGRPPHRSW